MTTTIFNNDFNLFSILRYANIYNSDFQLIYSFGFGLGLVAIKPKLFTNIRTDAIFV